MFVDTRWETILQQMQAGRYDCIVGGITITPERERMLAWSTPYMTTTLSLVVDARSPQIRGMADLRNASVGVQAATTDYDIAIRMQQQRRDRPREGLSVRPDPGRHGRSRRRPHHRGDEGLSGGCLARPADARPCASWRRCPMTRSRWASASPTSSPCSPRSIVPWPT